MRGVLLAFVSIQCGLLAGLYCYGVFWCYITILFCSVYDGWLLESWFVLGIGSFWLTLTVFQATWAMAFSCSWYFLGSPPLFPGPLFFFSTYSLTHPPFFLHIVLLIIYPVGSSLFFQFRVAGAGAGFFWQVEFVAGLQVGQALRCSSHLGLGLAVPAPHVHGHLTCICDEGI